MRGIRGRSFYYPSIRTNFLRNLGYVTHSHRFLGSINNKGEETIIPKKVVNVGDSLRLRSKEKFNDYNDYKIENFEDRRGAGGNSISTKAGIREIQKHMSSPQSVLSRLSPVHLFSRLKTHLLPTNYPHSVKPGYLTYAYHTIITNMSTTTMNFISTQALFVVLGSTNTQVNQLMSAALTWVLKDGLGQFGGIIFAGKYAHLFDEGMKRWRFFAFIIYGVSVFVEILTIKLPNLFLLLATLSNMGKNVSFLTASASGAAIHQHFTKGSNLGDITGKCCSQSIFGTLSGIILGTIISQLISVSNFSGLIPIVVIGTLINSISANRALRIIELKHLNAEKVCVLSKNIQKGEPPLDTGEFLQYERFMLPGRLNPNIRGHIHSGRLGAHMLGEYLKSGQELREFMQVFEAYKFIVFAKFTRSMFKETYNIHINYELSASNEEVFLGYLFAIFLDNKIVKYTEKGRNLERLLTEGLLDLLRETMDEYKKLDLDNLLDQMRSKEWNFQYIYIPNDTNRYKLNNI